SALRRGRGEGPLRGRAGAAARGYRVRRGAEALLAGLDVGDRPVRVLRPLLCRSTGARLEQDGAALGVGAQVVDAQERAVEGEALLGRAVASLHGEREPVLAAVAGIVHALRGGLALVRPDRGDRFRAAVALTGLRVEDRVAADLLGGRRVDDHRL